MPDATYNASPIFGQFTKQSGPTRGYRGQRSALPGVDGERLYRLGKSTQVWVIRGRLIAANVPALLTLVNNGLTLQNGLARTFVDVGGASHTNCILNDFRAVGPIQVITLANGTGGATLVVQGTVEQLSPDI